MLALFASAPCPAVVVIPIEQEKGNVFAAARINGVDVRLGLDSGGGVVALKPATAEGRRLPLDGVYYDSRQFTLGGRDFGPLQLAAVDFHAPTSVDGFIGYNFFSNHVVCIDPFERIVRVR